MDQDQPVDDPTVAFKEVIAILEKNRRYLEAVGLNPSTRTAYRKTVAYLRRLPVDEISMIMGSRRGTRRAQRRTSDPTMSDDEFRNLSADQIRDYISSKDISRKFLERMARFRFGMTSGALSAHGSRAALVDKLDTMLAHEGTHEAIARVVGSDATKRQESSASREE